MSEKVAMFISYRREDSAGHVGRLYDTLSKRYGTQQIFVDIDHIGPGEDFVRALDNAVAKSMVMLVIIGKHWVVDESAYSRLKNPNDFVRLEVVAALQRGLRVIPVLVRGAPMPSTRDLPRDLHDLTTRNAFELSDLRWHEDTNRLIGELDRLVKSLYKPKEREPRPKRKWVKWVFAVLILAALGGYARSKLRAPSGTDGTSGQTSSAEVAPPDNVAYNAGSAKDEARRWRKDAQLVWVDIQHVKENDLPGVKGFTVLYQFVSATDGRLMSVIDTPVGRRYLPVTTPIRVAIYPVVLPFMDLSEALKIATANGFAGGLGRAYLYWRPRQGRPALLIWTIYPLTAGTGPAEYNINAQTGALIPIPELMN